MRTRTRSSVAAPTRSDTRTKRETGPRDVRFCPCGLSLAQRGTDHPFGQYSSYSGGSCYRCDVKPAPLASPSTDASSAPPPSCAFSYQEYAYLPSSRCFANFVSFNGWNVSHMTASSCVSCVPIDFSASPGCGPCGRPDGCSVIEPTSTPLREPNLPET